MCCRGYWLGSSERSGSITLEYVCSRTQQAHQKQIRLHKDHPNGTSAICTGIRIKNTATSVKYYYLTESQRTGYEEDTPGVPHHRWWTYGRLKASFDVDHGMPPICQGRNPILWRYRHFWSEYSKWFNTTETWDFPSAFCGLMLRSAFTLPFVQYTDGWRKLLPWQEAEWRGYPLWPETPQLIGWRHIDWTKWKVVYGLPIPVFLILSMGTRKAETLKAGCFKSHVAP